MTRKQRETLVAQLRAAIQSDGRTQRQIADDADIDEALVSRLVNKPDASVSLPTLEALARTLGLRLTKETK